MLGLTSALIGIAGILRWDFGAFGLLAVLITGIGIIPRNPTVPKALALDSHLRDGTGAHAHRCRLHTDCSDPF
jgi:hypothetical protein